MLSRRIMKNEIFYGIDESLISIQRRIWNLQEPVLVIWLSNALDIRRKIISRLFKNVIILLLSSFVHAD